MSFEDEEFRRVSDTAEGGECDDDSMYSGASAKAVPVHAEEY
jgi:hypothetical protein